MNNKIHNPIDKSNHASNILIIQATLIKGKLIKVVIQLIRAVKGFFFFLRRKSSQSW